MLVNFAVYVESRIITKKQVGRHLPSAVALQCKSPDEVVYQSPLSVGLTVACKASCAVAFLRHAKQLF